MGQGQGKETVAESHALGIDAAPAVAKDPKGECGESPRAALVPPTDPRVLPGAPHWLRQKLQGQGRQPGSQLAVGCRVAPHSEPETGARDLKAGRARPEVPACRASTALSPRADVFGDSEAIEIVVRPKPNALWDFVCSLGLLICPASTGAGLMALVCLVPSLQSTLATAVLVFSLYLLVGVFAFLLHTVSTFLHEAMRESILVRQGSFAIYWTLWGVPVYWKSGRTRIGEVHLWRRVDGAGKLLRSACVLGSKGWRQYRACARLEVHLQEHVLGMLAQFLGISVGPDDVSVYKDDNGV